MFHSAASIRRRTGAGDLSRFEHLQQLVSQYEQLDASSREAYERLAKLANFAYDPINFDFLWELNVAELFLDAMHGSHASSTADGSINGSSDRGRNTQTVRIDSQARELGAAGLCNFCLGASIDALLDVLANKSRSIEMRRLFPEISAYGADFCVASFDCAWAKDILRHGRLYLSLDHLCFYSNILGIIAKVTIPLRSISYIQKRQTAVIIPNAISFTTIDGKSYFFATFNARDSAYEIIARIWRPLAPLQITSQEQFQQQQQQGTDLAGLSEQVPPLDLDSQDRGDALLNELQDLDRTNQPFPAPSMLPHELRSRRSMIPLSPPQSMQSNQRNSHHSLIYTIFSDPAVVLGFMVFLAIFCTLSMLLTTLTMLIRVQSIANDIDIDIAR
eukprot:jgi/Hompol1/6474/HPOL_002665-RA